MLNSTLIALLVSATPASGATLDIDGACPGRPAITVSDATPDGTVFFVVSSDVGDASVPGGLCAGLPLGLSESDLRIAQRRTARPDGGLSARPPLGPFDCGAWMVALDLSSCSVSEVAQVGPPLEQRRTFYDALGDFEALEVVGEGSTLTGLSADAPASLSVALLNGVGVVGGRYDRDVDDGEALTLAFEQPAWAVSLTFGMVNDLSGDGILGSVDVSGVDAAGVAFGPVRGVAADLEDVSGFLGVDALRELTVRAVGDSVRLTEVGHLVVP